MQTDVCIPSERGKVFSACAFSGFMVKSQGHVWKLLQPMQTNPQYMCIDFGITDRNSEWLKEQDCRARTVPDELTFQLRAETTIRDMLRAPYVATRLH